MNKELISEIEKEINKLLAVKAKVESIGFEIGAERVASSNSVFFPRESFDFLIDRVNTFRRHGIDLTLSSYFGGADGLTATYKSQSTGFTLFFDVNGDDVDRALDSLSGGRCSIETYEVAPKKCSRVACKL